MILGRIRRTCCRKQPLEPFSSSSSNSSSGGRVSVEEADFLRDLNGRRNENVVRKAVRQNSFPVKPIPFCELRFGSFLGPGSLLGPDDPVFGYVSPGCAERDDCGGAFGGCGFAHCRYCSDIDAYRAHEKQQSRPRPKPSGNSQITFF